MTENVKPLLSELKEGMERLYGKRLKGIYLYGSYARGDQGTDSDVDVIVVLDRLRSYASEVDCSGHVISGLSLNYGVSISRVFASESEWRTPESPFLNNAREEAIQA